MAPLKRAGTALLGVAMLRCSAGTGDARTNAADATGGALDSSADATANAPEAAGAASDAGALDSTAADARDGSRCPPNVPCGCVCPVGDASGDCVCDDFSERYCPPAFRDIACQIEGGCMGCSMGSGYVCGCRNPDGSTGLFCLGTEQACAGGAPY